MAETLPALHIPPVLPVDLQDEAYMAADIVKNHTMVSFLRLAATYRLAVFCDETAMPGAFVECGTWKGGAAGVMAVANMRHGRSRRNLHLFDSFQDLCAPDEDKDGARALNEVRAASSFVGEFKGQLQPMTGVYDQLGGHGTVQDCRNLIEGQIGYPGESVHYHEGWFQDTLAPAKKDIGWISILRLDGDLYASTKVCLDELFDQVIPGGFVIFDDYGAYEGCRTATDEFLAKQPHHYLLHHIDAEGRYLVKQ